MSTNRLFNTVRNISWRFVVLMMTAIANIIIPRYIILIYGSEVNGLTTSISHLLMIVNLIQAGLGSSVTYLLYSPIELRDRVAIASIIESAKRIYRYISIAILGLGIGASFIFAYVVKTELQRDFILIASLLTCINSAASTYFTAAGNIFLSAKQDGYIVSRISIISNIISYILSALVIILRPHYIMMYVNNMVVCIINVIALSYCFKKRYVPFALTDDEKKHVRRVPIRGVSYAAANEAAHAIISGSITVVVSVIAGLKASSVFAVYMIAVSALSTFSNSIYSAFVPSYGSVVAENNMEKTNRIFEIYQFVLFTLNAFMYMCAAYLMIAFVRVYTKGVTDAEYINPLLMIFMVAYGLANVMRIPYNNTVYIKGLFKETYLQSVVCSVVSLALMIGLTMIDYTYTLIGAIFFYLSNTIYQHFKLPKLFEGFDNHRFWNHCAVIVCGVTIAVIASYLVPIFPVNFIWWVIYACGTAVVAGVILVGLLVLLDKKSLKCTINYFISRKRN